MLREDTRGSSASRLPSHPLQHEERPASVLTPNAQLCSGGVGKKERKKPRLNLPTGPNEPAKITALYIGCVIETRMCRT